MNERRIRQHRRFGIEHRGQRLGIHLHQLRRVNRDLACLGDDDGNDIAVVTNLVVGKDAVVADDLAEAVHAGHILRGQHPDNAGKLFGGAGVNREDARVNEIRIRRRGVEHVGELEVVREFRLARDLGISVVAPAFLLCGGVHDFTRTNPSVSDSLSSPEGGEGWGEEARFYQLPLSPALSPLVPRGERETNSAS